MICPSIVISKQDLHNSGLSLVELFALAGVPCMLTANGKMLQFDTKNYTIDRYDDPVRQVVIIRWTSLMNKNDPKLLGKSS